MPGGAVFGALFFLLLAFAAVTSIIAIIEPIVSYAVDRWDMARRNACIIFGFLAWLIGIASVLSFNVWQDFAPLDMIKPLQGKNIYDLIDYLTANLLMPIGGILIAVFVGWRLKPAELFEELGFSNQIIFKAWFFLLRFVAPLAILAILIAGLRA